MTDKTKVIFYNSFNIGDVFFAQPFIKNVIENNKNFDYYLWIQYGYFAFSDFPNLKNVNNNPNLLNFLNFRLNDKNYLVHKNHIFLKHYNILLINTWIGSMHHKWNSNDGIRELFKDYLKECDLISYLNCYKVILETILNDYNIKIDYNYETDLAYPVFPKKINIDSFLSFKTENEKQNKKVVFLNNYKAMSYQTLPIKTSDDYISIINFIIGKNYIVILAEDDNDIISYINNKNINGVYFCSNFVDNNLNDYTSSSSLFYNSKICVNCDFSVYFDTGRNFLYFNIDFINDFKNNNNKNNTKIHLSTQQCEFLFKSLNNSLIVPYNYSAQYIANNVNDVIDNLDKIL
jgi:hypothetical protein